MEYHTSTTNVALKSIRKKVNHNTVIKFRNVGNTLTSK